MSDKPMSDQPVSDEPESGQPVVDPTKTGTWDCIIVGAGPTGATLGCLLGQAGHRVLLLERDPAVYALPRAVHMDHEILRILQQVGIAEALQPFTRPVDTYRFQNAAGEVLIESRGDGRLAVSGHPASVMFVQPELERLLRERLQAAPGVVLRTGAEVLAVEPGERGEPPAVSYRHAGAQQRAHARFVVGCDGASSLVRRTLGVGVDDLGFDEPWAVVDMQVRGDIGVADNVALQFCDPARPTTCVPAGPGRRRWEFMLRPGETPAQMGEWAAIWPLLAPWGGQATLAPVRLAVYRFHALIARQWRVGTVLLAGDAAHQTPPFMGQGLCSGLRDAANLAWKLDRVLRGRSPAVLLDTYAAERAPHIRAVVEASVAMGRIVCEQDPQRAAERDRMLLAARATGAGGALPGQVARLTGGLLMPDDPGAGWLFPQPCLQRTGAPGQPECLRFDDLVGPGAALVVDDAALLTDRVRRQAAGLACVSLDDGGWAEVAGAGPSARHWLAGKGVRAALVRPDRYVLGTASDAAGVARLADVWLSDVWTQGAAG